MNLKPFLIGAAMSVAVVASTLSAHVPDISNAASFSQAPRSMEHNFALAADSDPMLFQVIDVNSAQSTSRMAPSSRLSNLADIVETSSPGVVQVRVQKLSSAEDTASSDDDTSLLDFLRRFGAPVPDFKGAPESNNPFGAPPPDGSLPLPLPDAKSKNVPETAPRIPFPKAPSKPRNTGGVGSGFFIDESGYLLTNAHVVEGAYKITLRTSDHKELDARLIGLDKRTDIALLKVDGGPFKALPIGAPDKIRVGDRVIAIGSPFGLEFTATAGILSAKGRSLPSDDNYIPFLQTDAAVNPGSSGGPLINERGQAIGVNSQIYSQTGGYMGISFAIPIDYAIKIAGKLRRGNGVMEHGRIGALLQNLTPELAEAFDVTGRTGAIVLSTEPGSPADTAGLKSADVVLLMDGKAISGSSEMVRLIADSDPGDKIIFSILRKGSMVSVPIVLTGAQAKSTEGKATATPKIQVKPTSSATDEPLGIQGRALTEREAKIQGVERGIKVLSAQGMAEEAGINSEDVILTAGHQSVGTLGELAKAVEASPAGKPLAIYVKRGPFTRFLSITPDPR